MRSHERMDIDKKEINNNSLTSLSLKDISSIAEESVKINQNLSDAKWTIIGQPYSFNNGFKIMEIHAPWVLETRNFLQKNPNEKLLIVWKESEEEIGDENKYEYAYEFHTLKTYQNFRYVSYKKLLDKEYMKNLYTEQEKYENSDDREYWFLWLNMAIRLYLWRLSKFTEFSFEYEVWWNTDLDTILECLVNDLSRYCPEFLWLDDKINEVLRFLKNFVTNLLHPNELRYIRDTLKNAVENAKKDEFRDPFVSDFIKNLTKVIAEDYMWYDNPVITFEEFPTSLESKYKKKPPLNDQLNESDELKLAYEKINMMLNEKGYPRLFYSIKDLINSYEIINEKCNCFDIWDEYYEKQKKEWKDIEYKKLPLYPTLPWVYCDIDGTLVKTKMDWKNKNDYEVNEKVVKKLLEFYKQWKKITLRSSWTLLKKQDRLWNDKVVNQFEEYWLTKKMMEDMWIARVINGKVFFNIKNKYAYRYRIPEIVIDDRDSNRFMYHMNIYPEKFINIKDL